MKIEWKKLIGYISLPIIIGAIVGWLTSGGMEKFKYMNKPPLSPPGWLFPVVWTILYALMGISYYLIKQSGEDITTPKRLYIIQLFFNYMWSFIYFNMDNYLFAFIWLVVLWILIILTAVSFYRVNKTAGLLYIPYIIWVTFAGYLNLATYLLNRMV